mgnify:CR=1 FL=1
MALRLRPGEVIFTYDHDAEIAAGINLTEGAALVMGTEGKAVRCDVTEPGWQFKFRSTQTFSFQPGELLFNEPGSANPIFVSACGTRITSWETATRADQQLFSGSNGATLHGYGDSLQTNYSDWAVKDKATQTAKPDIDLKRKLTLKRVLPQFQSRLFDLLNQDCVTFGQESCKPFILETYRFRLLSFLEEAKKALPEDIYESLILKRASTKLDSLDEELGKNTWLAKVSAKPNASRAQPSPAHLQGMSPERFHRDQPHGSDVSRNHNPVLNR